PSMNPGIAVMPCASMVSTAETFGVPAATDASRPFRMTMEPRSMTVPFPIMIRAFVITRFWADSPQFPDRVQNQASKVSQTALFIFLNFGDRHRILQYKNSVSVPEITLNCASG